MRRKLIFILFFLCIYLSGYGQRFVNPSGTCAGGTPCFSTISLAITAASAGETITVEDGTYNENVLINKNLTLVSANGRSSTTIIGSSPAFGTILVNALTSGVTIQGFTIVGYDSPNPGIEFASLYFQGSHSNVNVLDNEIMANGEHAFLFEFGATVDNVAISGNIFSGKTFVGNEPGGCGFAQQFTEPNVPRTLVFLGGLNKTNIVFNNNMIIGQSGAPKLTCAPGGGQGNNLVVMEVNGGSITGNTFNGSTARFASLLNIGGMNNSIGENYFDLTNSGPSVSFIFKKGNALIGGTPSDLEGVLAANNFTPGGAVEENISSIVRCEVGINCPDILPIPTLSNWGLILLCILSLIFGLVILKKSNVVRSEIS